MTLPTIDQANISGKRIFVRGDIDVPLAPTTDYGLQTTAKITDDSRLQDIWPTIKYLLDRDSKVIIGGHLGRPGGVQESSLSSRPVAQWLATSIQYPVSSIQEIKVENLEAFKIGEKFTLLENLRFDPREEANDEEYGQLLASLVEVYVNESFAESHKSVASIVGIPKYLPHYAGFRLAKEVKVLTGILESPDRPLVVIIGGAKLETKIPVINKMAEHADIVIVGGKLLEEFKSQFKVKNGKIKTLELSNDRKETKIESVESIQSDIASASTIVWNGPLGAIEEINFQNGTKYLAELIIANQAAYKVVGGGDTVAFLNKIGLADKFNWVSSGGGAMLSLLSGRQLPGLTALGD